MDTAMLCDFYEEATQEANASGVSDPIMFGHCVKVYVKAAEQVADMVRTMKHEVQKSRC